MTPRCAEWRAPPSQPPLRPLVCRARNTESGDTGIPCGGAICEPLGGRAHRLQAVRVGLARPRPGGQATRSAASSQLPASRPRDGAGRRFELIDGLGYAAANRILGRPARSTPSSRLVGDLGCSWLAAGVDPADFEDDPGSYDIPDPSSGLWAGELGDLPGGWPSRFAAKVLTGATPGLGVTGFTEQSNAPLQGDRRAPSDAQTAALCAAHTAVLAGERAVWPNLFGAGALPLPVRPFKTGLEHTIEIETGGKALFRMLEAISEAMQKGMRTFMAHPQLWTGQLSPRTSWPDDRTSRLESTTTEKADPSRPARWRPLPAASFTPASRGGR